MKNNFIKQLQNFFGGKENNLSSNSTASDVDGLIDDISYIDDLLNSDESYKIAALNQVSQTSVKK